MAEIKDCCSCIYETRSTFTEPCVSCGFDFRNYTAKPEPKRKRKRKNRADIIRTLTDEELAIWMTGFAASLAQDIDGYKVSERCEKDLLEWLKQEAET